MIYDEKSPAWAWSGHQDSNWDYGRPSKKQRRESGQKYGYIVKPLAKLVRDSWDSVNGLTESLRGVALSSSADAPVNGQHLTAEQRRLIHEERISGATALEQWTQAAEELDRLDGCDAWKADDWSEDYDAQTLRDRIAELESARDNEDLARMLRLIRTSLSREVAGIGNPRLYQHSRIGTKDLIEHYVATAVDTIESATRLAARCSIGGGKAQEIKQDMLNTRQAYGRTALILSGGGTFGMMHIGVAKAMFEAGVLPRVVSGTSAGSIVAAVLCTRKDDEIPDVVKDFCHGDLTVFSKPGADESLSGKFNRFRTEGQVYDIKHLDGVMRGHLGDMTFQEAYNRTQRILCIAVSPVDEQDEPVLLSYATTPNVVIRSAVTASCSVPGIYASAGLEEKCPQTGTTKAYGGDMHRFIDGSVSHDIPLVRLQEMYDVNHFIVSQVNPHVVPFLRKEDVLYGVDAKQSLQGWWGAPLKAAKDEVIRRLGDAAELAEWVPHEQARKVIRTTCHITRSVLEQQYTGDITILPDTSSLSDWLKILSNPTPEFMKRAMEKGERATWPEIDRIKKRTAVEHALDSSVRSTLERVAFSPSQVELRLSLMRKRPRPARYLQGRRYLTPDEENPAWREPAARPSVLPERLGLARKRSRSMSLAEGNNVHQSRSPSPAQPLFNSSTSPLQSETDDSEFEDGQDYIPGRTALATRRPVSTVSLPATPFNDNRRFSFSEPPDSPKIQHPPALTMTPSSVPDKISKPEQKYKRLFHSAKGFSGRVPWKARPAPEADKAVCAEAEVSGTEAPELVVRRNRDPKGHLKRSQSTGIQFLRPPERQ